ncbi:hypothetical protein GCM10011571_04730 [Marinithermofilum abyssi]|uniref:Aminoglycoside phosphotransferase domain-containing protein n=1 Tax=Marinithermofilum abyssi TaxID=1571185 RepID=A0A8J2VHA6_9BACL|nr:phosphotransferase [Marinithermofilum abyssi]GGE06631.1 hypothetical protein GCM10011571_04730 [Marinithermofilum abyssi]
MFNTQSFKTSFGLDLVVPIVKRKGTAVYRAVRDGEPVLLKVHTHEKPFVRETDSISRLAVRGAPVPKILETCCTKEWWDGVTLKDLFFQLDYIRQVKMMNKVGRLLARIQSFLSEKEVSDSVFWKVASKVQTLAQFSWKTYYSEQYYKWVNRLKLQPKDLNRGFQACLNQTEQALGELKEPEKLTILHNDYGFRNIMVSQDGEPGIRPI